MAKLYQERKEKAREEAIEWQCDFGNRNYYWSELAEWIGLLADDEGRDWLKAIENNQIYVVTDDDEISYYPTGCSMTQWNEDCEEITNQVERILNEYNLYDHDRNTNVANSNQLVTVLEILKKIK